MIVTITVIAMTVAVDVKSSFVDVGKDNKNSPALGAEFLKGKSKLLSPERTFLADIKKMLLVVTTGLNF